MNLIELLNKHVAAAIDLHARCKHAHWNVKGSNFIGVHQLFDSLAENAEGYADTLAERARFLNGEVKGTVQAAAKSFLVPYEVGVSDSKQHLPAIVASLTSFSNSTKAAISTALQEKDQATADIFIEITRSANKDIYLTRSHITFD